MFPFEEGCRKLFVTLLIERLKLSALSAIFYWAGVFVYIREALLV